jgi:hypothetical protein
MSSRKVLVILAKFYLNLHFLNIHKKNPQISNFIKIRPLGAELFHSDLRKGRQADMTKLGVAFLNFTNAPKIKFSVT